MMGERQVGGKLFHAGPMWVESLSHLQSNNKKPVATVRRAVPEGDILAKQLGCVCAA